MSTVHSAGSTPPRWDPWAIGSFLLSLIGLLGWSFFIEPVAIGLAIWSMSRIRRSPVRRRNGELVSYRGIGFAIAALVIAPIGIVLAILYYITR